MYFDVRTSEIWLEGSNLEEKNTDSATNTPKTRYNESEGNNDFVLYKGFFIKVVIAEVYYYEINYKGD